MAMSRRKLQALSSSCDGIELWARRKAGPGVSGAALLLSEAFRPLLEAPRYCGVEPWCLNADIRQQPGNIELHTATDTWMGDSILGSLRKGKDIEALNFRRASSRTPGCPTVVIVRTTWLHHPIDEQHLHREPTLVRLQREAVRGIMLGTSRQNLLKTQVPVNIQAKTPD
jgi:hypothetical protein